MMPVLGFKEGFSQEFLLTDDREEKAWENDCIMSEAQTIDDCLLLVKIAVRNNRRYPAIVYFMGLMP